jgi:hypothetical protein
VLTSHNLCIDADNGPRTAAENHHGVSEAERADGHGGEHHGLSFESLVLLFLEARVALRLMRLSEHMCLDRADKRGSKMDSSSL